MPMVPPAPARLSYTIVCPICRDTWSNTGRATASTALPGGNGEIRRIACLVGHACPWALPASATARRAPRIERRFIGHPLMVPRRGGCRGPANNASRAAGLQTRHKKKTPALGGAGPAVERVRTFRLQFVLSRGRRDRYRRDAPSAA